MVRKNSNLFFFLLSVFILALVAGCKKEEVDPLYMSGALTFNLPSYTFPGEKILVEASGVTRPHGDSVVYTFKGKYFTPDSVVAQSVLLTMPDSLGTYTLTLLSLIHISEPTRPY